MVDAIVIGGGPAGAVAAMRLAAMGCEVIVLERAEGPVGKVCGEFLSHEAVSYITGLGVDLRALGAVDIESVRLCMGSVEAEVRLPFPAAGLSRRLLDEALLTRAIEEGAMVRRGMKVNSLSRYGSMWSARTASGFEFFGEDAFLATGKHDIRTHRRPEGGQDDLVAFKLHWRLAPSQAAELDGHVELALFRSGYAGLQPVEFGRANLCLVVRRRRLLELEQRWDRVLEALCSESPHLAKRLEGAEPCSPRPLAVSWIPYGYVCQEVDGLWRLGDQAVVIPSLVGDGMAIALHSAELAAAMYRCGGSPDEYQQRLGHDVRRQVGLAMILSRALVWRPSQVALTMLASVWPRLMAITAARTRIDDGDLVYAQ
jgi:flavin-dependent dehydrogenase